MAFSRAEAKESEVEEEGEKEKGRGKITEGRECVRVYERAYIYYTYITARTGQSITSLLNLTDLMAGRNGAAARKKRRN